jgi:hypothetical protein
MLNLTYSYASCVSASEKVAWKIDDLFPVGTKLDFSRAFLPEGLSADVGSTSLSSPERLKLNQITGNAYLNLFAFVEEYIIATAVQHANAELFGDHEAIRALVRFADEEVKHQKLFLRYCEAFNRDFGHPCGVLGAAAQVAAVILSKSPLAVMMVTLHLEIMTQQHYTECVRDNTALDPLFSRLLKAHWLEESQHARIDALELDKMLSDTTAERIDKAFADYLDLIGAFDGLLESQAKMDLESLSIAVGRPLTADEKGDLLARQHRAYRRTFLVYGMENPMFAETLRKISPTWAAKVKEKAANLQ